MKKLVNLRMMLLVSSLLLFVLPGRSQNTYYVSPDGTATTENNNSDNPMNYATFRTALASYASGSGALTVYFTPGMYDVSSTNTSNGNSYLRTTSSSSGTNGLTIVFDRNPNQSGDIIFDGGNTNNCFLEIREQGSSSRRCSITMKNIILQKFAQNDADFLISMRSYHTILLDSVVIREGSGTSAIFSEISDNRELYIRNSSIENCNYRLLAYVNSISAIFEFTNNKVEKNTFSTRLFNFNATKTTTLKNNIIKKNIVTSGSLILVANSTTFSQNIIEENIIQTGNLILLSGSGSPVFENNILKGNKATTYIINSEATGKNTRLSGNTISDNEAGTFILTSNGGTPHYFNNSFYNNKSGDLLIYFYAGTPIFYNNTVSNNNTTNSRNITINSDGVKFFNNTIYNSGNILVNSAGLTRVINNIIAGTSGLGGSAGNNAAICMRNISSSSNNVYFYVTGNNTGEDITTDFGIRFDTDLSGINDGAGKQVHKLKATGSTDVILARGGKVESLYSELSLSTAQKAQIINIEFDQMGYERPDRISIGSFDIAQFEISSPRSVSSMYNSNEVSFPPNVSYDLSTFISLYPPGVTDLVFTISGNPINGAITQDSENSPIITFFPNAAYEDETSGFDVTVRGRDIYGIDHSKTFHVYTLVYDLAFYEHPPTIPPGYTLPEDYPQTCFDFMGTVVFKPQMLISTTSEVSATRLEGFTIPLVADLNGDGSPEIIAQAASGNSGGGSTIGIQIFSGQTGASISRITFPEGRTYTASGSHQSPSAISLVDSDRDGVIELIVAHSNSGTYVRRLASYNINYDIATKTYSLSERWVRTEKHSSKDNSDYAKGIPQIVDLDGDGRAEVVVYNRIYDAELGTLLMTWESGSSDTPYMGLDDKAPASADEYVNFSYIYDVDLDGTYDVAAGGKLYKITKDVNNDFQYDIISAYKKGTTTRIPDGRTGVADINGDGIPDIVVAKRVHNDSIRIVVWNPGFFEMTDYVPAGVPVLENDGKFKRNSTPQPYIMADMTYKTERGYAGSNSYVYIGDIDGREQIGPDGKTYRLPEIAILSAQYHFASAKIHPNVFNLNILPTSGFTGTSTGTGDNMIGMIAAFTWDLNPTNIDYGNTINDESTRLKLSFGLCHNDRSSNTGFTMFDFDNDGKMEICYRDEQTLRIIKAAKPYIEHTETDTTIILLRTPIKSYTGFELPIIADINNDASAEMVVLGHPTTTNGQYHGWLFAVGAAKDKFAPAWPVWNQFMYDPFKINPDLTTPTKAEGKHAINRLTYSFKGVVDKGTPDERTVDYNPFNGTLIQATKFMMAPNSNYGHVYEPIIFLTESYIVGNDNEKLIRGTKERPEISGSDGDVTITITVGNKKTALTGIAVNTPVAIYKNGFVSQDNYIGTYTLEDFVYAGTTDNVNEPIKSDTKNGTFGDNSKRISITLTGDEAKIDGVYILRLGDDSQLDIDGGWEWKFGLNSRAVGIPNPAKGIGVASRQFRDCDWDDQTVRAAKFNIFHDAATVQAYNEVEIDVFANDILPETYFDNNFTISSNTTSGQEPLNSFTIMKQPVAGNLVLKGTARDLMVIYQNTQTDLDDWGCIDSFEYRSVFIDPTISNTTPQIRYATAYIYILQSETGLATCDDRHTVQLKKLPTDVDFDWYKMDSITYLQSGLVKNIVNMQADSVYIIEPKIPESFSASDLRNVYFPKGKLTVIRDNSVSPVTMKWKGIQNTDWYNPQNWVEVKNNNTESPVLSTPTSCVNVIISSDAPYYPELKYISKCQDIKMEDRAMIAGIDHLEYENASVEIKLKSTERDRFVMWSAPLKAMYSGDYHLVRNGDDPVWGDAYINFFQSENPDYPGSTINGNTFTATFGHVGTSLGLGKPFNLNVTTTTINKNLSFIFPRSNTSYTGEDKQTRTLNRTGSSKFITYQADRNGNYTKIPLEANGGYRLVQVVNPYMAYLDLDKFFAVNSRFNESYKIWSGYINEDFVTVKPGPAEGGRLVIDANVVLESPGYIAPLQSFFVVKKNVDENVTSVLMSSNMTTTTQNSPYKLRAEKQETNILRIKATQEDKNSFTVLNYAENAMPAFKDYEDVYKGFYDETPLTVYTFTPSREPMAINTSGDYTSWNVPIGLRIKEGGLIKLDFSGMETFGHNVYLIDKQQKGSDREIDLQKNPSYIFTVNKNSSGNNVIVLEDRFELRMDYTGIGLGNESTENADLNISSQNGYIHIQSGSGLIQSVQVYNISGAIVYSNTSASSYYRIRVDRGQTYVVRVRINKEYIVRKVLVS